MLKILSWNCQGFPWNKGPKLSWISNEVDIILLVETWEHKESRVPNIDGFVLWSTWNKRSPRRGIGGIACYIKKNISPHARIYKIDPYNQYMCNIPKISQQKKKFFTTIEATELRHFDLNTQGMIILP